MRRLSVLALLLAALVVSTLPASAAPEKDHFQAHLKATDAVTEGNNSQGQVNFWFEDNALYCNLEIAAVYNASSVRLMLEDSVVMNLFEKSTTGRFSGQAIKGAFPPSTFYDATGLIGPLAGGSIEDLKEAMLAGENVYVSISARPDPETEEVEVLRGEIK